MRGEEKERSGDNEFKGDIRIPKFFHPPQKPIIEPNLQDRS
jgi:hypothetical protein